jgi:two-component system, OmpR family, sensor histidine kinase KdpD
MNDERPEPESFLDLVAEPRKGRLKIYVGAAAGVGKTWRMLEEAHEIRGKGVDIVLALIETHGRAETAAKIGDLEVIPRRRIEYRGKALEEMDIDAVLARKPEVALVDELAHTNVPGSRHPKRYQDVEELLAAGINVISAMNIQHVQSLNPLMKRLTGVEVRETVPDSILTRADQIVNVDVTAEALRERLREGKIYPKTQIEQALRNFFKPSNLVSLREIALREVARGLSRQREDRAALQQAGGHRAQPTERVMVGLSSNPYDSDKLLRKACRIATQLGADWYAVHVETPAESVSRISTSDFVALLDNINLAGDLGAETVWLKADNVVEAMLEFARTHGITKIVIGRTHQPLWRRMLKHDVARRLIDAAEDFDVEMLGDEADEQR